MSSLPLCSESSAIFAFSCLRGFLQATRGALCYQLELLLRRSNAARVNGSSSSCI